jgi:RimJ/RimL family protein N-acetyltransferase
VSALFTYLFTQKEARRLYAYVEDYNLPSQKLCARLHMRQEGCFKEFVSFTDEQGEERYDSTYVYALLKRVARAEVAMSPGSALAQLSGFAINKTIR